MDSAKIKAILITTLVAIVALWLGLSAATAQVETGMWVSGISAIMICAILGKRVWMILPFMAAVNLTLFIPGQPDTNLISYALFIGFCGVLFLLKKLPYRIRIDELDIWVLLLIVCAAQAYIRNPVGLNIFGGSSVGAKPYAIFLVTLMTSVVFGNLIAPAKDLHWITRLHIMGGILNFLTLSIGYFVPKFGVWVGSYDIKGISATNYQIGDYGTQTATRVEFVRGMAKNLALWISAYKSPIKACFHPVWMPLVLGSFAMAAFSGYRNEIAAVGLTYLVGLAYRGGHTHLLLASMTVAISIGMLMVVNLAVPLPANVQRSLTFLPGTWDEKHKEDAKYSTQWRMDMWQEALFTDYWIQNKWLGDGLGMTKKEYAYVKSFGWNQRMGQGMFKTGRLSVQQELMMATNNYHSGPVSSIRTVGYVGLIILLTAQIRLAVHAHRLIRRLRQSEWFPLSLIIAIPIIWQPFFFVFVFGDYGPGLASFLMGAAFIKFLRYNIKDSDLGLGEKSEKDLAKQALL